MSALPRRSRVGFADDSPISGSQELFEGSTDPGIYLILDFCSLGGDTLSPSFPGNNFTFLPVQISDAHSEYVRS